MRTQFYLNLLVLHFQRRLTDIDCDIFPRLFLLAGHSFTFMVIYCSVTHIFFFGPLSTLCCLCLADKELFVLSQLGAILAISNVGGGIVLTFFCNAFVCILNKCVCLAALYVEFHVEYGQSFVLAC